MEVESERETFLKFMDLFLNNQRNQHHYCLFVFLHLPVLFYSLFIDLVFTSHHLTLVKRILCCSLFKGLFCSVLV